ncbi:hypothetical protein Tco_1551234, partial [Tanacetum coccineum]
MKDLVANKQLTEEDDEVRMNPRCSAPLQNHLPPKENDPGSFILSCSIRQLDFNNALADLGASISIMPFSMFKCLGRGKLELIRMIIERERERVEDVVEFGEVSETAKDKILRYHWIKRFRNDYDDSEDFEDPDGCRESKENKILGTIINKLHDEWFKGTHEDGDDLEGIIDYLEPTLYDGFIDSDDEGVTKHIIMGENIDWLNKGDL